MKSASQNMNRNLNGRRLLSIAAVPALTIAMTLTITSTAAAQGYPGGNNVFQPLNQRTPPGVAGRWAGMLGRATPRYYQPVRIQLPSGGKVIFYHGPGNQPSATSAAQVGLAVGQVYRIRISHMPEPEFKGIELYPSVEVIDRLHPPAGMKHAYPIPVKFTYDEIRAAVRGRLVTKVVYLEQPQLVVPKELEQSLSVLTIPPNRNLIMEADRLGRPMLIVRLGGRLPDVDRPDPAFFGTGASIEPSNAVK